LFAPKRIKRHAESRRVNHPHVDSRSRILPFKVIEERSNHQQLRGSGAPSFGAQRRIPCVFKKTAPPFFQRQLNNLACTSVEFDNLTLPSLPRGATWWPAQLLALIWNTGALENALPKR
jgi:hypothetical protein